MTKIYILKNNTDHYGFVKQLAAEKNNIEKSELILSKGNHGKPYFENLPDFHFNISHSGNFQVIAISNRPIGIDVERLKSVNPNVAKRFCKDEYGYITECDSDYRFIEIWTKKEAYLKYLGEGLHGGLNSFSALKTDIPIKTFKKGDYIISVCGTEDFEIIE
ncbi:MAG: 4'-phosphopantetheinyl transferase superfamily protein [Clostridia bacterium]|nr:4'-phosphopantetheinyl transferase superfamily protein [Clostridia bacterium]